MAGVAGRFSRISAAEVDHQWPIERRRDPKQRLQVGVRVAAFEAADDHATQSGPAGEFDTRPAASFAQRLDLRPEPGSVLQKATIDLNGEGSSPTPGMIATCSFAALTRPLPRAAPLLDLLDGRWHSTVHVG